MLTETNELLQFIKNHGKHQQLHTLDGPLGSVLYYYFKSDRKNTLLHSKTRFIAFF